MRTVAVVLFFGAMGWVTVQPAAAQGAESFTGESLRDACDSLVLAVRGISPISQEDPGAMLCLGFLAGWTQAMTETPDKPYCLPQAANSRPGDLADLIVTYVDGHPDRNTASAHEVLLETFTDAFPCASEEEDPEDSEGEPQ